MLKRLTATAILVIATTVNATAAEFVAFTTEAFTAARKAGKGIIIHVHAPWCPTCRAQMPILDTLAASPEFKDVVALRVDFDSQPDAKAAVDARSQSTVVVYKGDKEVGRTVGATDATALGDVAHKAL